MNTLARVVAWLVVGFGIVVAVGGFMGCSDDSPTVTATSEAPDIISWDDAVRWAGCALDPDWCSRHGGPSGFIQPHIQTTVTWHELDGEMKGSLGKQWLCDPEAEITVDCRWDYARGEYVCRVNWGDCAPLSFNP